MLERFGTKILTMSFLLAAPAILVAQQPIDVSSQLGRYGGNYPTASFPVRKYGSADPFRMRNADRGLRNFSPVYAGQPPVRRVSYRTNCTFAHDQQLQDAIPASWIDDQIPSAYRAPILQNAAVEQIALGGVAPCLECAPGFDFGNFDCASCNSWLDFEKRAYVAYVSGDAGPTATKKTYGDADSLLVGVELLPFRSMDNDREYIRFGLLCAFQATHYSGNDVTRFLDPSTGQSFRVQSGETYGLLIGPTARQDFYLPIFCFGDLHLSPNLSAGATLEWTELETTPVTGGQTIIMSPLQKAGFDVGGYVQVALDLVLSDAVRLGAGGFFRFVPTDVLVEPDTVRVHLGLIAWMSREF